MKQILSVLFTYLFISTQTLLAQALDQKVSLPAGTTTGLKLVAAIKTQFPNIRFTLDEAINQKLVGQVNVKAAQPTVKEVLDLLKSTFNISYKNTGNYIMLSLPATPSSPNVQAGGGPGTIKGRIVEFETSQPLAGASVKVVGAQIATQSNGQGYYNLTGVPAGKHTLEVSFVGYSTETVQVTVRAGRESTYDVKMQGSTALDEVTVSAIGKTRAPVAHTTERQVLAEIKNAQSVVSGISSEQISKSADRNAAEVVQKIAGVTVRDDKLIIIRGLNERYNITYLNGNIAPSTELYSRAFALDLIPTRIIDRILVYKSPAPDLSADMTGGAIKIFTKDAKTVKHFDMEVQGGYRENTTFNKNFLTYQGGKWDFLGFDDGTRKLPSSVPGFGDFTKARISQKTYAETFSPYLQYGRKTALPTMQLTANYYNSFKVAGHNLSMLSSLSYKNEPQHLDVDRTQGNVTYWQQDGTPYLYTTLSKMIAESQNNEAAQLSLLQNFTYTLRDSNTFYFKNFLLQQGQNSTILRNTYTNQFFSSDDHDWYDSNSTGYNVRLRDIILSYSQRFLYSGNVGGNHYLGKGSKQSLNWNGGYTYSQLDIPDQRAIHLQNNIYNGYPYRIRGDYEQNWIPVYRSEDRAEGTLNNNIELGMISRIWIRNTEQVYNGSMDYTYKPMSWVTLKAGTYQQWKQRVVFRRAYTVNEGDVPASGYEYDLVGETNPDMDFNLVFFNQQDLGQVWSNTYLRDDGTGLKVFDRTSGSDAYTATEQNNSGYMAVSLLPFNGKLDIYGGIRVEYNRQKVAGALPPKTTILSQIGGVNRPVLADLKTTDYLPSLNLTYRPNNSLVIRGGYGKTVNRPEFRELSPYSELDYINNQSIQGNTDLLSAMVDNYDLRMEWYPQQNAKGESISLGGFYKAIEHPIERIIDKDFSVAGIGWPANISFLNADQATIRGLELDIRKNLDFIPLSFFRNLSLIANGSWIYSSTTREQDTTRNVNVSSNSVIKRQLQGQSPYSVNAGLYYENAGTGTKVSLTAAQVGPRIYAASVGSPAIYIVSDRGTNTADPGDQGSLIELTRRQLDFSVTQRLVKSLQAKLSIQNLLNDPIRMAEDANFTYKYERATFVDAERANPDDLLRKRVIGDLLASDYKPGRFFLLTLTYGF